MFCGAPDHVFRSCPQHGTPSASIIFYKHLFTHKPHLRKGPPFPVKILPANPSIPVTQSFPIPTHVPPLPPLSPPCLLPPPSPDIVEKHARFFMVQIIKPFSMHTLRPRPVLAPMPITIDNGLPCITFPSVPILLLIQLSVVSWTLVVPSILVICSFVICGWYLNGQCTRPCCRIHFV